VYGWPRRIGECDRGQNVTSNFVDRLCEVMLPWSMFLLSSNILWPCTSDLDCGIIIGEMFHMLQTLLSSN